MAWGAGTRAEQWAGAGGGSKGETGLPGSDCRAEKRHQLGTRQPKARDPGSGIRQVQSGKQEAARADGGIREKGGEVGGPFSLSGLLFLELYVSP